MLKRTVYCFASLALLLSSATFAASDSWTGLVYNIMPRHAGVTEEFCKTHTLNTYHTTADMIKKKVTSENGVMAENKGYTVKQEGGIYVMHGAVMLSGKADGKPWTEKANYIAQMLDPKGMEQGAWYTKDCKGFYRAGPDDQVNS